jgi:hypothetical protein
MKSAQRYFGFAFLMLFLLGSAFSFDVFAQRSKDARTRDLVRTLNSQLDDFKLALDFELSNNRNDRADDALASLADLKKAVGDFESNFVARRENRDDVNSIISAARLLDSDIARLRLNRKLSTDWEEIKRTISSLAQNYGVVARLYSSTSADDNASANDDYDSSDYDSSRNSNRSLTTQFLLTGTYRLDQTRSENTDQILNTTAATGTDRDDLENKIASPEMIAIDVRGNQVTLATSNASAVTFIADGTEKVDNSAGQTLRFRATLNSNRLVIASRGGDSDYTITFEIADGGRTLHVTRRITTNYLRETLFVESFYNRTDTVAQLGIGGSGTNPSGGYSSSDPNDIPGAANAPYNQSQFLIPDGTIITALLESSVDTAVSQNNDRFKLTVQSPLEYRGAVIEGKLVGVGRSGRVSGQASVTFNFETITLRDGRRFEFAGVLQSIKDQNGKTIKVDNEGTAKGDSQTKETAKRGGIGAGLGALIGVIAGGGKGAAIGAIIGGSAGAGSVIATGKDDVKLLPGSLLTIQAAAPRRQQ